MFRKDELDGENLDLTVEIELDWFGSSERFDS